VPSESGGPQYQPVITTLRQLEQALASCIPDPCYPHDRYVQIAVEEALVAAREGNGGIGALLIGPDGEVVEQAHNQVLAPYFRSDLHAEMTVMTRFEDRVRGRCQLKDYMLCTSLEPCPMCVVRLSAAGVGTVIYAAADGEGGMAATADRLPPVWAALAGRIRFAEADCSPMLKDLAQQTWLATAVARHTKIGLHA
jgi:tRNA(adenine34) deaminase